MQLANQMRLRLAKKGCESVGSWRHSRLQEVGGVKMAQDRTCLMAEREVSNKG